ncbi:MAG: hypothetical protein M1300_05710 [Epsilonproteobacteria bacterium]|nr:hypothetical protein [Campylobacterota bacterium]
MTTIKKTAIVIVGGMVLAGSSFISFHKSQQDHRNQVAKRIDNYFNSESYLNSMERYILSKNMDFTIYAIPSGDSLMDSLHKNNKRIALVQDFDVPDFFKGDKNVSSTYISSIASGMEPVNESQCVVDGVAVCFDTPLTNPSYKASNDITSALNKMGYKIVAANKK